MDFRALEHSGGDGKGELNSFKGLSARGAVNAEINENWIVHEISSLSKIHFEKQGHASRFVQRASGKEGWKQGLSREAPLLFQSNPPRPLESNRNGSFSSPVMTDGRVERVDQEAVLQLYDSLITTVLQILTFGKIKIRVA